MLLTLIKSTLKREKENDKDWLTMSIVSRINENYYRTAAVKTNYKDQKISEANHLDLISSKKNYQNTG